jgi:hypothetical protein
MNRKATWRAGCSPNSPHGDRRIVTRFLLFSSTPMAVVPFTQHGEVVQAAIQAGGIGRGLSETDIGRALLAGAEQFERRAYSGSRIVLLVSDGAAQIDPDMRERIARALKKHRIAVYWVFIRSALSQGLEADPTTTATFRRRRCTAFLKSTGVPYQAFEAEDPEAVKQAVAEVDRQQNLPLDYAERIPRRDFSAWFFALALLAGALALVSRLLTRPSLDRGTAIMKVAPRRSALVILLVHDRPAVRSLRGLPALSGSRVQPPACQRHRCRSHPELAGSGIRARTVAVRTRNDYEGAVRAYKALSRTTEGTLLQSVLYNLGNLHLREALKYGPDEIGRSLPLAELAKTSYRELLHLNPGHWNAKYNLERALRLAPEREDVLVEAPPLPQNSERAVTTMKAFTLGLP